MNYFDSRGFGVRTLSPTQRAEKLKPYDLDVRIRKGNFIKRFGLQIKRPHVDSAGIYWGLNAVQHGTMQRFRWVFYAFPTFVDAALQRVACHHVLIVPRFVPFRPKLRSPDLGWRFRWGGFAEALLECRAGETLAPERPPPPLENLAREFNLVNAILADVDFTDGTVELLKTLAEDEEEPREEE